jgi:hypothetical protein
MDKELECLAIGVRSTHEVSPIYFYIDPSYESLPDSSIRRV